MDFSAFGTGFVNNLFYGILEFIVKIATMIFAPLITLISSIFPQTNDIITYLNNMINTAITHIPLILDMIMCPRNALVLFFDFLSIEIVIYTTIMIYKFIMRLFKYFKVG